MKTERQLDMAYAASVATDKEAETLILNTLGHVAFMAWLVEGRDQRDRKIMTYLTRKKSGWNYTKETREKSWFLPAAYDMAYWEGRQ